MSCFKRLGGAVLPCATTSSSSVRFSCSRNAFASAISTHDFKTTEASLVSAFSSLTTRNNTDAISLNKRTLTTPFVHTNTAPMFHSSSCLTSSSATPVVFSRLFSLKAPGMNTRVLSLANLKDNMGAKRKPHRVGRGIGSGRGKTAKRGHKGMSVRSGGSVRPWYEGGQTPLYKRTPKRGFTNFTQVKLAPLNLSRLMLWISSGKIDPTQPITLKVLKDSNVVRFKHGVKLLGQGAETLKIPLQLEVSDVSASARAAIEGAGGKVLKVYFNRLGLRAHLVPQKFDILPKRAAVPPRLRHRNYDYPTHEYMQ